MPEYVWKRIGPDTLGSSFDLEGDVVWVSPRRKEPFTQATTALVKSTPDSRSAVPEGVAEGGVKREPLDVNNPTCIGKGGECSRTVDEPGDACWQHEEGDE